MDRPGLVGGRRRQSRHWLNATAATTLPDRARVSAAEGGKDRAEAGVDPGQTVAPTAMPTR
jgi:hypothetical protein